MTCRYFVATMFAVLQGCFSLYAQEQHNPLRVQTHNVTDQPFSLWIGQECVGEIPAQSVVEWLAPWTRELLTESAHVMIVGARVDGSGSLIAAVAIEPASREEFHVVWGGVSVPSSPLKPAEAGVPGESAVLLYDHWKRGSAQLALGLPLSRGASLIGTSWHDRIVRGGTLSVRSGDYGRLFIDPGITLVWVSPGTFTVAQRGGLAGREVTFDQGFFIGITEVTVAQYADMTGAPAPHANDADYPQTSVTWSDAVNACGALSSDLGWRFALPTEWQWEFTCGGGQTVPFSPSDVPPSSLMWYGGNSGGSVHRVATRGPNARGVYDMNGNVREWCRDWWGYTPPVGIDPQGPALGTERVRRGGAYDVPRQWCTCGNRDSGLPEIPQEWQGFRIVLELQ